MPKFFWWLKGTQSAILVNFEKQRIEFVSEQIGTQSSFIRELFSILKRNFPDVLLFKQWFDIISAGSVNNVPKLNNAKYMRKFFFSIAVKFFWKMITFSDTSGIFIFFNYFLLFAMLITKILFRWSSFYECNLFSHTNSEEKERFKKRLNTFESLSIFDGLILTFNM